MYFGNMKISYEESTEQENYRRWNITTNSTKKDWKTR